MHIYIYIYIFICVCVCFFLFLFFGGGRLFNRLRRLRPIRHTFVVSCVGTRLQRHLVSSRQSNLRIYMGKTIGTPNHCLKKRSGIFILIRTVFLYFLLWVKDLAIFELRFGFLMRKIIYGQMETSGNHQLSRKTMENYRDSKPLLKKYRDLFNLFLL